MDSLFTDPSQRKVASFDRVLTSEDMEEVAKLEANSKSLSFLDLPYEIRRQIYRYVLYCEKVNKEISPATNEIFLPLYAGDPHDPLYPSILAVCGFIHEEAAEVLYGENEFYPALDNDPERIVKSWFMADRNFARIAKLDISIRLCPEVNHDGLTLKKVAEMFPRLYSVAIEQPFTIAQWEDFIRESADTLNTMRQGRLLVDLSWKNTILDPKVNCSGSETLKARCIAACKPVVEKYMPDKAIRWEFRENDDVLGLFFEVYLFWGGAEVSGMEFDPE